MTYSPAIKYYAADGSGAGTAITFASARFALHRRGGCRGGTITMAGHARAPLAIPLGAVVRAFYNSADAAPYYTGVVTQRARQVGGTIHEYEISGLSSEIARAASTAYEVRTGDSVREIVAHLLDTYVMPTSDLLSYDTTSLPSSLDGAAYDIGEFLINDGDDLVRLFDQLCLLAAGCDGSPWTWFVDAAGKFSMSAVSTAEADLQVVYSIGVDATEGREEESGRSVDRLTVIGNRVVTGNPGWRLKKTFALAGALGGTRAFRIAAPAIRTEADAAKLAAGWGVRYSMPPRKVDGARRVTAASDDPPRPWVGQALVTDTQRGDLAQLDVAQLDVEFGAEFLIDATFGVESDADSSDPYAPPDDGHVDIEDPDDNDIDPEVTDTTDPPDDYVAPPYQDTTSPPGGGLSAGQIIKVHVDAVVRPSATINWLIEIDSGGASIEGLEVRALYETRDATDSTQTGTSSAVATLLYSQGNISTWQATATAPAAAAWLRSRVRVQKPGTDPAEYWYWPDDATYLLRTQVDDGTGGEGTAGNYYVGIAYLDPEA